MENEEVNPNDNIEQLIGEGDSGFQDDETASNENSLETSGSDESSEVAPDQQQEEKKIRKEIDKSKYNKLKRERYEAINKLKQLREENEQLKKASETYSNAAMTHYDRSLQLKLEQAEQLYAKAVEDGDVAAQTKAQVELAKATAQMVSVDSWKEQQKYQEELSKQAKPQEAQQYDEVEINENMQEWLEENPWIVPSSPEYDADMAEEVVAYAKALDRRYARNGMSNKIASPEYFNEVNNYIQEQFYGQKPQERTRNISMKPVNNNVAPVGRTSKQAAKTVRLSPSDQAMARRIGMTDEQYLPFVLEAQEKAKNRNGLHGGF